MAQRVVERLQADDVDVRDDERLAGAAAAIDLAVEVGEAGGARARSGQRVDGRDRELVGEDLAVDERVQALARRLLAILRRGLAVVGGERALLGRGPAVVGGVVAGARREVAHRGDRIALVGGVQARLGGLRAAGGRRSGAAAPGMRASAR